MRGLVGERQWKKLAILKSVTRVLDEKLSTYPAVATHEAYCLAATDTVYTEHTRHCNHDQRVQGGAPTKSPGHGSNRAKLLPITFEPRISVPAKYRRLTTSRRTCFFCLSLGRSARIKYSSFVLPTTIDPA